MSERGTAAAGGELEQRQKDVLALRSLVARLPITDCTRSPALQAWWDEMKQVMEATNPTWFSGAALAAEAGDPRPLAMQQRLAAEAGRDAPPNPDRVSDSVHALRAALEAVMRCQPCSGSGGDTLPKTRFVTGAVLAQVEAALSRVPAPGEPPLCAHRFDSTVCVAPAGHEGPHVTSNGAFPHGLVIGGVASPPSGPPPDWIAKLRQQLVEYQVPDGGVTNVPENCVVVLRSTVERLLAGASRGASAAPPEIRLLGDPILRRAAAPFVGDSAPLVARLQNLRRASKGVGLAAPQIGESVRVVVVENLALVNPRISWRSEETATALEGCLSIPGYEVPVTRPVSVVVEDDEVEGIRLDGLSARVAQHEIDHLDGILILDRWLEQRASRG